MIVTLFGKDKKEGVKLWRIEVSESIGGAGILTIHHGKVDGKLTRKDEVIELGKQGRNPYQQAVNEAEARIKKQRDKGYRDTVEELEELPLLAMLAGDNNKIGHRIEWDKGVDISDKFDGVRVLAKCTYIGVITLESRTGQPYDLPHIVKELQWYMNQGDVLDGEIYLHGEVLQDITSAVKRTDTQKEVDKAQRKLQKLVDKIPLRFMDESERAEYAQAELELAEAEHIHELRPKLQFHVFDAPSDLPWTLRLIDLGEYATRFQVDGFVKNTNYQRVFSVEELKPLHKDAVSRGYEGVMLRNAKGLYESGKRSADLQKYKEFVDAEFTILDVLPAKDDGSVFWVLNDLNQNEFSVTLGSMAQRAEFLANKENYIGKPLTVQFQSRYKRTLLPQFPTGKAIRDYE